VNVILPVADREDVKVVQADLEFMQAVGITGQLHKRAREYPQTEAFEADELQRRCKVIIERRSFPIESPAWNGTR